MHRIGHVDILIDQEQIRPDDGKKSAFGKKGSRIPYKGVAGLYKCGRDLTQNSYTFWYFAEITVARRLRASFFGGKRRSHAMALRALVG
jgi:hypothetical protein